MIRSQFKAKLQIFIFCILGINGLNNFNHSKVKNLDFILNVLVFKPPPIFVHCIDNYV